MGKISEKKLHNYYKNVEKNSMNLAFKWILDPDPNFSKNLNRIVISLSIYGYVTVDMRWQAYANISKGVMSRLRIRVTFSFKSRIQIRFFKFRIQIRYFKFFVLYRILKEPDPDLVFHLWRIQIPKDSLIIDLDTGFF